MSNTIETLDPSAHLPFASDISTTSFIYSPEFITIMVKLLFFLCSIIYIYLIHYRYIKIFKNLKKNCENICKLIILSLFSILQLLSIYIFFINIEDMAWAQKSVWVLFLIYDLFMTLCLLITFFTNFERFELFALAIGFVMAPLYLYIFLSY